MGYNTHFTGTIEIRPPLTWPEFKDSPFLLDDDNSTRCLILSVEEDETDTPDGTLTVRTATDVHAIWEDPFKAYEIVADLQELVDASPGHEFVGHLSASGDDDGDLWRLQVIDGRATKVQPRIVWPDGTEESQR